MRLNTECLPHFIGYYIGFFNNVFYKAGIKELNCKRILRLTRRSRRLFLDDFCHVRIDYCLTSEGKPQVGITLTKDTNRGIENATVDRHLSNIEPVDISWFIPYVDRLSIKEYDGKLINDDTTESDSKKIKYDDHKNVWEEYEEITICLIKSLENVKIEKIDCNLKQIKILSNSLSADVWNISNDDFTVEQHDKLLNVEVSTPNKRFVDFLQLAYDKKCDDIEKLDIEILGDYQDRHITDITKLQKYLPLLKKIKIHWNYECGKLSIVDDLMGTKFERPMKITITSDDCRPEYDDSMEMINLMLSWRKLDPNVTIKLCITDGDGIEEDLSNDALKEFERTEGPEYSYQYTFVGDRLKVIVTEDID